MSRMDELKSNLLVENNKGASEDEMISIYKVPSNLLKKAIEFGYIIPSWNLTDYIRQGITGQGDIKKLGFNGVAMWGELGSGKSNLCLQLAYVIYRDWDIVLSRVCVNRADLLNLYRTVREKFERIPLVILDDVTTMLPRSLWQEDRELYTLFQKFLGVVRPKISGLIVNLPDLSWLHESLFEVMNFEVNVTPNQKYQVQRFYREVDPFHNQKVKFMKILVEYSDFKLEDVPKDVYKEYFEKRVTMIDDVTEKLEAKLGAEVEGQVPEIDKVSANQGLKENIVYNVGDEDFGIYKCAKCGAVVKCSMSIFRKYKGTIKCGQCQRKNYFKNSVNLLSGENIEIPEEKALVDTDSL